LIQSIKLDPGALADDFFGTTAMLTPGLIVTGAVRSGPANSRLGAVYTYDESFLFRDGFEP